MPPRFLAALLLLAAPIHAEAPFKLLRSLSGPSGKTSGTKFVFDQTRTRFVYPQDRSLVVYFEWDAPPGTHTLSAIWKPPGRPPQLSTEIKIENHSRELNAYWIYDLAPHDASGVWTLEIRIDGSPAGSHVFEVVVPEPAKAETPVAPPTRVAEPPSLSQIYEKTLRSMVWLMKLNGQGRQLDTCSGFVIGKDRVATAFQCVDGAVLLELVFAGGHKVQSDVLAAWNRTADWAIVQADTGSAPAIESGDPVKIEVGRRMVVLNVEGSKTRVIGGVDITGFSDRAAEGRRYQIDPQPSEGAIGGPLLDLEGKLAGMLGGTLVPGSRHGELATSLSPALFNMMDRRNTALPVTAWSRGPLNGPRSLPQLKESGVLTSPVTPMPSLSHGGTTNSMPKSMTAPMTRDVSLFSRRDPALWVYTLWQRRDKQSKGVLSGAIYDAGNRPVIQTAGKKISIPDGTILRTAINFSPAKLAAGMYRVDLLWDGAPVWRTWVEITD